MERKLFSFEYRAYLRRWATNYDQVLRLRFRLWIKYSFGHRDLIVTNPLDIELDIIVVSIPRLERYENTGEPLLSNLTVDEDCFPFKKKNSPKCFWRCEWKTFLWFSPTENFWRNETSQKNCILYCSYQFMAFGILQILPHHSQLLFLRGKFKYITFFTERNCSKPNLGGAAKVEREGRGSVYSANDYHPYLYIVLVVASTETPFWRFLISAIHTYSM